MRNPQEIEKTFCFWGICFGGLILYPLVRGMYLIFNERYVEERQALDLFHQTWYLALILLTCAVMLFFGALVIWEEISRGGRQEATWRLQSKLGMLKQPYQSRIPPSWIYFGGAGIGMFLCVVYVIFFQ